MRKLLFILLILATGSVLGTTLLTAPRHQAVAQYRNADDRDISGAPSATPQNQESAVRSGPVVTFFCTNLPEDCPGMRATIDGAPIQSGATVGRNDIVTFTASAMAGYHVDWYVNGERYISPDGDAPQSLSFDMKDLDRLKIEGRYVENFKYIFKGTPFVKYADANGVIVVPANYYHHKYERLRAFGYSLQSWSGSNGKTYLPDNIVTDTIVTRDTLTADVVMTPNFVLNEEDLGDATVTSLWEFGLPDSVALFSNFQDVCCFVKPTLYNSYYIDMNMTINAKEGWIDNEQCADEGYAEVGAGTKFSLPARYGTIYKMVTKDALSATTIADSTSYKKTVDTDGNHVATLFYYESTKDSIDIVIGEDIRLVSVSASYPGGDNYMSWTPAMKTDQDAIITVAKSDPSGCLLFDISDIEINGGLNVTAGTPRDSLSAQIEVPAEFDESKYLSVSFQMGEGFSYKHKKAFVQMRLEGENKSAKVKMTLSDTQGNLLESKLYEYVNADSVLLDTLPNFAKPNDIYLYDRVTMKLYVYGEADNYRLFMPITSSGEICEVLRFPEGYVFTPYVAKSEIDLDGIGLLTVDAFEVVGVDDEARHVTLNAIEEVPMGDILIIHSDQPGAVHNIPLTRADDAYVRNNNKLWVSDGTVRGGRDIYRFAKDGDTYVFRRSSATDILPDGEVYLKYHSATNTDTYYLTEEDVPQKVEQLTFRDDEDNRDLINQYKGRTVKQVLLDGHAFFKNHMWNTLCLPFDVIAENIDLTPLCDAEIWELDIANKDSYARPTGYDPQTEELTLNFKPARNIEPGKPYVFEWRTTVSSVIDNPVFENVTIKSSEEGEMAITSNDGTVQFVGTYAPAALIANTTANLYMGPNDKLDYPKGLDYVNAFYAYVLVDLGNGLGLPGEKAVKKVIMNITGEEEIVTEVIEIVLPTPVQDDSWYDLQGRKYNHRPSEPGIYIMNGRKILIQ